MPAYVPTQHGDPRAPGLVLVHGTRMAGAYWQGHLATLSARFHVVTPDLPGHGARREEPFTHAGALETIRAAIATCAGGKAVVLGHSLGGFLAMDLAAASPELFDGLVLMGCSAIARGAKTLPYRLALALLPLFSEKTLARWNDRLLRHRYPAAFVEPQIAAGCGFGAIGPAWRAVLGRDHTLGLRRFPAPVLVLNGARDPVFRLAERRFVRACPHARLCVIPGASHLCNLDRPAAFEAAVRTFVESVAAPAQNRGGRCEE